MCQKFGRQTMLFQLALEQAAVIGLPPLPPNKKNPFNHRNVTMLMIFALFFVLTTLFVFFDAKTFQEYALTFLFWMSFLGVYIGFFAVVVKTEKFYKCRDNIEELVKNRK